MAGKAAFLVLAAALGLLAGCLDPFPEQPAEAEAPVLRPEVFFAGRTLGEGTLDTLTGPRRSLRVEGHGYTGADGAFQLDQSVIFSDGRTETRSWRLSKLDSKYYSATLTDAAGVVAAEATGNSFHLRYLLRRPWIYMEQRLYLQPDGRTVLNLATVTVMGIPWARLSEKIERIEKPVHPL